MPVTHAGHSSPPHQIHNPTPSYPSHSNLMAMNSSSPYHSLTSAMSSSSIAGATTGGDSHPHQIDRNDSPTGNSQYSSSLQLPPTPNSLVTIVGPNSGNSNNSNDAVPLHDDSIEPSVGAAGLAQSQLLSINNNNNNNHYSPWANSVPSGISRPMPPLSPPEFFQQLGVMGSSGPTSSAAPSMMGGANQMHHHHHHHPHIMSTGMSHLHHNNGGAPPPPPPSFMQQSLPNFAAHTSAKNFSVPQPYYWY